MDHPTESLLSLAQLTWNHATQGKVLAMDSFRADDNPFSSMEVWRPAPPLPVDTPHRDFEEGSCPVGVVVSCHNYGRYLAQCLHSIFNQTTRPATVVVVDDSSSDDTADVCRQFPDAKYLKVNFRHIGKTRRAGLMETSEPFVLFVDADNWLEPDFIEQGMLEFTDRTVAGVYSDYVRFGASNGSTNFPNYTRGELFRRNFVDTCTIVRRDALELIDWVWDVSPVIPDDYLRAQALAMEGWAFRKQHGVFHYRCHDRQTTKIFQAERTHLGYMGQNGLANWPITLFIPLCGRKWAWKKQSRFLDRQTYPHDRLRILLCDTSRDPEFSSLVRSWALTCDYPDVRHMCVSQERGSLADECRHDVDAERQVNLAMCRIYNLMRNEVQTEFVWVLEDDILPPEDVLTRLLTHFHADVASVSAPYNSRYDLMPVVWNGDANFNGGTPRCEPRRRGVEKVRGSGFGCLVLRTETLRQHVFSLPIGARYYDPEFFKQLGDHWIRLCDWSCWCKHLDPKMPKGYV